LSDFLFSATPHSLWTSKIFAFGRQPQRFPDLPGASDPGQVAEMLLHHFFPPKPPPPPLLGLTRHEDYTPLTSEEISRALSKSSNISPPGHDHIPYSVWESIYRLKPSLLPSLLDPLLAHSFHPPPSRKPLVLSSTNQANPHTSHPPPSGLLAWASLLREGYTRYAREKVTSRLTPHRTTLTPRCPARYAPRGQRPSNMPSCPAPRLPTRDPASSMGSRTCPLRPQSPPTSNCLLHWLTSFAPLPPVSLLECPRSLAPSKLPF